MAKIADLVAHLESLADPKHQESYDNAGLITGQVDWEIENVLIALDATEEVIEDAIRRDCKYCRYPSSNCIQRLKKNKREPLCRTQYHQSH